MNARTDPSLLSKEATRRINERQAWALGQREQSEKRIATVKAELEREKREKQEALERMAREATMVTELLQEMYQLNPEFAARRQAVLQVSPLNLTLGRTNKTLPVFSARQSESMPSFTNKQISNDPLFRRRDLNCFYD